MYAFIAFILCSSLHTLLSPVRRQKVIYGNNFLIFNLLFYHFRLVTTDYVLFVLINILITLNHQVKYIIRFYNTNFYKCIVIVKEKMKNNSVSKERGFLVYLVSCHFYYYKN